MLLDVWHRLCGALGRGYIGLWGLEIGVQQTRLPLVMAGAVWTAAVLPTTRGSGMLAIILHNKRACT